MKIGSLFSGYGGLDLAVESVFGASPAWFCEYEAAPSKVLATHWPSVPNLGDITGVDWAAVEPVDIITGGSPCQDLSHAGKRAGMTDGTRSNLWVQMREAIDVLRPSLVVWENVRGALSADADSAVEPCPGCVGDEPAGNLRALGRVLGDLAELGYDARWHGLRAADVGAPHGRFRVFVVAHASGSEPERRRGAGVLAGASGAGARDGEQRQRIRDTAHDRGAATADAGCLRGQQGRQPAPRQAQGWWPQPLSRIGCGVDAPADTIGRGRHEGRTEPARIVGGPDAAERGAVARDAEGCFQPDESHSGSSGRFTELPIAGAVHRDRTRGAASRVQDVGGASTVVDWGQYAPAIRRWEHILGRPAPAPTEPGTRGGQRLSPRFVEWMMGLPAGWVTDVPISRNDQLKALGNGVVPQQAAAAIRATAVTASLERAS